jgi:hypothetical protein
VGDLDVQVGLLHSSSVKQPVPEVRKTNDGGWLVTGYLGTYIYLACT